MNIENMVTAVIADDPEAVSIAQNLKKSLKQTQSGQYTLAEMLMCVDDVDLLLERENIQLHEIELK